MASRFLCYPETAVSLRRNQSVLLPKGTVYSSSIVKQMIEDEGALDEEELKEIKTRKL